MTSTLTLTARRWLDSRRLYDILLVLNVLVSLAVFFAFRNQASGDQATYLGYAEGLAHGRYSYWYFLPDYVADTFRNPGYPLFLFVVRSLTQNLLLPKLMQLGLYFWAVWLALRGLRRLCPPGAHFNQNLFLLLLLPNVQGPYFAAMVFPEILVMLLVMAYFQVALTRSPATWARAVLLALLAGAIVQTRPVFILFPLVQVVFDWLWLRPTFRWHPTAGFLLLFGLTLLPYGLWNQKHHHVFKVTSLEGGGGVMQIGFWALRMPNYHEVRYWGNTMGDEVISFVDPADVPGYIQAFNREWDAIDQQCIPLLTPRDRAHLPQMRQHPELFPTYSSPYTIQREKLLVHYTVGHILAEPSYFLKTRLYTLVRLWVTGVQRRDWAAATTPLARLKVVYPALVSGLTFLLTLVCIPWALLRQRQWQQPAFMLGVLFIVYFGVMHLPFSIQARYTVPVRLLLLFCVAQAVTALLSRRSATASAPVTIA